MSSIEIFLSKLFLPSTFKIRKKGKKITKLYHNFSQPKNGFLMKKQKTFFKKESDVEEILKKGKKNSDNGVLLV